MKKLLKNKKIISIARKILEIGVLAVAIIYIGKFLFSGWDQISDRLGDMNVWLVLLSLGCFFGYFILRSLGWFLIMKILGAELRLKKAGYIWFISEFSRYVPGNVWSFLGRVYLSNKEGVLKSITSVSLVLEMLYLLGTSLLIGLVFFLVSPIDNLEFSYWWLVVFIPMILLIINPNVLNKLLKIVLKKLKKEVVKLNISFGQSWILFLVFLLAWALYGLGSYLTAKAFVDLSGVPVIWLMSTFVLVWAIGYLSFITPMGLGVREGAVVAILKTMISAPLASLIALVTRVFLIISELITLGLVVGLDRIKLRKNAKRVIAYCKNNKHKALLIGAIILYVAYFMTLTFLRHSNYQSSRYDLGNMDQTVWNTSRGNFFQLTSPEKGEQVSRFSIHGDIALAFLAPIYWLWPSAYALLGIQTIVVALGALAVWRLSNEVIKNKNISLMLAVSYLLYPATQRANIFDFHAVTLANSLLIFAFYYAYKGKYLKYLIFSLLALATKETIAFSIVMISVYLMVFKKEYKWSALTGAIAVLWFGALLWWIMPTARNFSNEHFALNYYQNLGSSPGEIIKNIFLKPSVVFQTLFENNSFRYLGIILVPLGFLPIASLGILLALPALAVTMLSSQDQMRMIGYHYTSDITPFLYIALIFAIVNVSRWLKSAVKKRGKMISDKIVERLVVAYLLVFTIVSAWIMGPLPFAIRGEMEPFKTNVSKRYLDNLAKSIPQEARVSASNRMSPHFTHREISYLFPNGVGQADYIIVEEGWPFELRSSEYLSQELRKLENNPSYSRIYKKSNIQVFKLIDSKY